MDPPGLALVVVFDGNLAFTVRTKPFKFSGFTDTRKPVGKLMRKIDRKRQKLLRVLAGEAKHQALVAGTLFAVQACSFSYSLRDIRALVVKCHDHCTVLAVKTDMRIGIAYSFDPFANNGGDVDNRFRCDLACNDRHSCCNHSLAGNAAVRVLCKHRIENTVRYLIGNFIGVTAGYRFTCEKMGPVLT